MRSKVVFPGARGAQQGHQFAIGDNQIDVLQGFKLSESLRDLANFDAHGCSSAGTLYISGTSASDFHSTMALAISVTKARIVSSDATANAAENW